MPSSAAIPQQIKLKDSNNSILLPASALCSDPILNRRLSVYSTSLYVQRGISCACRVLSASVPRIYSCSRFFLLKLPKLLPPLPLPKTPLTHTHVQLPPVLAEAVPLIPPSSNPQPFLSSSSPTLRFSPSLSFHPPFFFFTPSTSPPTHNHSNPLYILQQWRTLPKQRTIHVS